MFDVQLEPYPLPESLHKSLDGNTFTGTYLVACRYTLGEQIQMKTHISLKPIASLLHSEFNIVNMCSLKQFL